MLVYAATLGSAGVAVRCEPVQGTRGVRTGREAGTGSKTWLLQWVKLQYYRWYVIPFRAGPSGRPSGQPS